MDEPEFSASSPSSVFGPEELLACYARGVFPMAEARDDPRVFLVEPDQRGVLPLDRFHIPSRLRRTVRGEPFEVRINAENPETFTPSPGRITDFHAPGGLGVRLDSAIYAGYSIPPYYDSLIGKLIVHGRDREEAIARLKRSLNEMVIGGVDTTIPLFQKLLAEPDILSGDYDIHWLEKWAARQKGDA